MAYYDMRLSLYNIAQKLNCYHSSINVFLKNYKKIGNYQQKDGCGCKRKILLHLMLKHTLPNIKWSLIVLTCHKLHQLS